jgi:hypothetical protein
MPLEQQQDERPRVPTVSVVISAKGLVQDLLFQTSLSQVSYDQYRQAEQRVILSTN